MEPRDPASRGPHSNLAAWEDFYNNAPVAYFSVGDNGRVLGCNRAATELTGYPEGTLLGMPVLDLYADSPEGKAKAEDLFQRFMTVGSVRDEELEMRRADGTQRWVSLTANAVRDHSGAVVASRSIALDITARKQAEAALRGSQALVGRLFAAIPDAIIIADRQGTIVRANPQIPAVFGHQPDELVGTPLELLVPPHSRAAHLQGVQEFFSHPGIRHMADRPDLSALHKDGHEFPVEITLAPVESAGETLAVAVVRDVTLRKKAEADIQMLVLRLEDLVKERTAELTAILECMSEGLEVIDADGGVKYFNAAASALTGEEPETVLGMPARSLIERVAPDREPPESVHAFRDVVSGRLELPAVIEGVITKPQRRMVQATIFPIDVAPNRRMTGVLMRDVTLERELERRRDEFIAVASHELRSPITPILGFAQLLLKRELPDETWGGDLQGLQAATQRLRALVDNLLDVTRIQNGAMSLQVAPVPLVEVVEDVLSPLQETTIQHTFTVDIPASLPPAMADRDKLAQIATNLLSNAVKYSPQGGEVAVRAWHEPAQGRVVLSVSDTGVGIAPEDQERLFTPFSRLRNPETASVSGSGLGLYIVKSLAEMMGGQLWLISQAGSGSTFFVALPAP